MLNIFRRISILQKLKPFQPKKVYVRNTFRDLLRSFSTSHKFQNMKIGTHDGVFHCDEVLACVMLQMLPEYKDAEIVRSRDKNILNGCDIVLDVGAVFDHDKKCYDHHQREFTGTLSSLRPEFGDKYNIKLSSAGLIYTFYGEAILEHFFKNLDFKSSDKKLIFRKVYENFIQEIDAIDNGVPMTESEPRYKIHTHLSNRIGRLNPEWNSKQEIEVFDLFKKAMSLAREEFLYCVNYLINIWYCARDYVRVGFENRLQVDPSGEIIVFTERFPWKEHLYDLESDLGLEGTIKYVIFIDKPGSWRVQAVAVSYSSFTTRKPLNPKWWGVRDEQLSGIANIEGCTFCHSNGFIGGNTTKEGAIKMAVASLNA